MSEVTDKFAWLQQGRIVDRVAKDRTVPVLFCTLFAVKFCRCEIAALREPEIRRNDKCEKEVTRAKNRHLRFFARRRERRAGILLLISCAWLNLDYR